MKTIKTAAGTKTFKAPDDNNSQSETEQPPHPKVWSLSFSLLPPVPPSVLPSVCWKNTLLMLSLSPQRYSKCAVVTTFKSQTRSTKPPHLSAHGSTEAIRRTGGEKERESCRGGEEKEDSSLGQGPDECGEGLLGVPAGLLLSLSSPHREDERHGYDTAHIGQHQTFSTHIHLHLT